MKIDYIKLGIKIKQTREQKGITQEQLAMRINKTDKYISKIERNKSIPSLETFIDICNALQINPDYILLDSIYNASEYMKDEIANKLKKCSDKQMKLISGFISLLLEQ